MSKPHRVLSAVDVRHEQDGTARRLRPEAKTHGCDAVAARCIPTSRSRPPNLTASAGMGRSQRTVRGQILKIPWLRHAERGKDPRRDRRHRPVPHQECLRPPQRHRTTTRAVRQPRAPSPRPRPPSATQGRGQQHHRSHTRATTTLRRRPPRPPQRRPRRHSPGLPPESSLIDTGARGGNPRPRREGTQRQSSPGPSARGRAKPVPSTIAAISAISAISAVIRPPRARR